MSNLNKNNGFSLIELIIIILAFLVVVTIGYKVYINHHNNDKSANSTNTSGSISSKLNDTKTTQDLAYIATTMGDNTDNAYPEPSDYLPTKLNQLKLPNLNYPISDYAYKVITDTGGEKDRISVYQICANFTKNTFSVNAFNNYIGSNFDATNPNDYGLHSAGQQCFIDDSSDGGGGQNIGLFLVLNNYEKQFKNQLDINSDNTH